MSAQFPPHSLHDFSLFAEMSGVARLLAVGRTLVVGCSTPRGQQFNNNPLKAVKGEIHGTLLATIHSKLPVGFSAKAIKVCFAPI